MGEKMYGPRTIACPTHGEQPVVGIGMRSTSLACGAYQGEDVRWWHPGEITKAQMEAASQQLSVLIEPYYGEDVDDGEDFCCYDCAGLADPRLSMPADVRQEMDSLVALINAYCHMQRL
jgi:hypothetical protein